MGKKKEAAVEEGPREVYLYYVDPATQLPTIIGKVFIDEQEDAWVRINGELLANSIGVENIDGVTVMNQFQFDASDK